MTAPTESTIDSFEPIAARWDTATPGTADAITAYQLGKAWAIAEHLAAENPFYRQRINLGTERTPEAFRRIPVTRKEDVVADCEAHPPYGSRTVVADDAIRMTVHTSGTSGKGTEVYALDAADEAAIVRTEAAGFLWAGVGPGTRVLLTIPVGMTAAGLWYYAALRFIGADVMSVGTYSTERKVQALATFGADMVIGTPSYVHRLAVACVDAGHDPAQLGVSTLMVAGEPYSIDWARDIERRWGATLYEQFGCTERAIGWTCPGGVIRGAELGVLHFPPESGYYEVIDPTTGSPADEDQEGELIVTPFGANASPLLRYATGDRVSRVVPGGCDCGRPIGGIRAGAVMRYDDMMKIKGVNLWPATFDEAIFSVEGISDYRGRVLTNEVGAEALTITVETEDASAVARVGAEVRKVSGLDAVVTRVETGTLANDVPEGFVKIKRWTDERRRR